MVFIHDTRDQQGKHKVLEAWMWREGHQLVRSKMYVGDIALLNDQSVCVDLKSLGLQEVYSNLVQSHERFRNECIRAQEAGIKLIILVEEKGIRTLSDVRTWQNPRTYRYEQKKAYNDWLVFHGKEPKWKLPKTPPVSSERLQGMMDAMQMKYGVQFAFCDPAKVGETVFKLLTEPR